MVAALIGTPLIAAPTIAHPPTNTDHGVAPQTFYKLWSGDRDAVSSDDLTDGSMPIQELANGTDIPLDTPPEAVEQWNRGDLQDFPETSRDVSIHPPDASLENGVFIQDAYIEVFAVQPSTHARLSPSRQPLYVAPDGSVLGTVDYRVDIPADDASGDHRVFWSLEEHQITETRLIVDGDTETTAGGTHTPSLDFSSIDAYAGEKHVLRLEADIRVKLEKHVRNKHQHCREVGNDTVCWEEWHDSYSHPTDTVTVSDSITVTEYDLAVAGFKARYPNGDLGLVIYKNKPWLGYSVPNGDVHGVWRFYSARDKDWDTLVRSSDSGDTTTDSPLHPLQTNAYPIETGPTPSPRGTVTLLETYGVETEPPTLPETVHLDILTQPYTASFGLATRVETDSGGLSEVTAWGLVRGVSVDVQEKHVTELPINRSNLTLTVLNKTESTVTVRVRLSDANTDKPINTIGREGYVVLAGERINTSGNGTVTETLPRPAGGLTARYEPGRWWWNIPGYMADSETVYVRGTVLQVVSSLYRMAVPISLFLLGVFIIDRITGWRVWPPWRGL